VYDVIGRRVVELANGELHAGRHVLHFDGAGLPTGLYVVRASVSGAGYTQVLTERITLVP
jgi:hypothetical protein